LEGLIYGGVVAGKEGLSCGQKTRDETRLPSGPGPGKIRF